MNGHSARGAAPPDVNSGGTGRRSAGTRRLPAADVILRGRVALPALVLLAVAALGTVAWASRPGAPAAGRPFPQRAQVTSATRICPVPPATGNGTRIATFSAAASGSSAAQSSGQSQGAAQGQGSAQLAALGSSGPPLQQVAQPGRLWLYSATGHDSSALRGHGGAQAPVAVTATGTMAHGLEAEETTFPQGGSGALTGLRCPQPGTDFWFAAPGQASAGSIEVYLANPDSQAASAAVDIYTDSGPLQGDADTGLTVPPGGRLVQAVDRLTPGSRALALHVRTSTGRVMAALQVGGGSGSWLPSSSQPATSQVIPGLPADSSGRSLYLADPGGSDASVSVQAIGPNGAYEPTGGSGIDVPAGTTTAVDMSSMNGVAAALRVTANVPVTAGLMAGGGYDSAAAPIRGQSVAADNASGHGYSTTLVLSAPATAARVAVSTASTSGLTAAPAGNPLPPGTPGSPPGQVVTIPAGRSTSMKIAGPRGGSGGFAIVVTPLAGSGPVYAGRVLSGPGGAQTIMPMADAPSWIPLPAVAGSLTAGMP